MVGLDSWKLKNDPKFGDLKMKNDFKLFFFYLERENFEIKVF